MSYPKKPDLKKLCQDILNYADVKTENGGKELQKLLSDVEKSLNVAIARVKKWPVDPKLTAQEPDSLAKIRALRPEGPRRIWTYFDKQKYVPRLEGAFLGRMAGCTLGAPVEMWSLEKMQEWAQWHGEKFPFVDYIKAVPFPNSKRYGNYCTTDMFTRSKMDGVPTDDDTIYTILGLLIAEDFGLNFTTEDVGRAWVRYLPVACTAEKVALENLKKGVSAKQAAEKENPYVHWIGADIRSDPWGYMAPGLPEKAAEMAYRDAYLSHRRNGIYGAMYFSAVIAAAFTVDDPLDALEIGLTEIPKECSLAKAVKWALAAAPKIKNYKQGRAAVDKKFAGMHEVHTINNACLTIFGITIGKGDFTRTISETVAMGLDNDCTAATAGSIVGAVIGKNAIPKHWYKNFNDTIHSYLIGPKKYKISEILKRFTQQARRTFAAR